MSHELQEDAVYERLYNALGKGILCSREEFMRMHLVQDLGLDSLDCVTLFFDLQDEFDVTISDEDIEVRQLLVVGNLMDFVANGASRTDP